MAKKLTKYQAKNSQVKATTDSRTPKGLADGKLSKSVIDYSAREIGEGIYNTVKTNASKEYKDLKKVGDSIYNEAKRKAGQASDAFDAGYNLLFKKKGGPITALNQVQDMYSKMYSKKKK